MTDIDTATGLPTLPEGYFWRVNRESVEIRKSLPDTDWRERYYNFGIGLCYEEDYGVDSKWETRKVQVLKPQRVQREKWFSRKTYWEDLEPALEEVNQYRYVNRSQEIVVSRSPRSGDTTVIPGKSHAAEYRSRYGGYSYSYGYQSQELVRGAYTDPDTVIEHRKPVTRENIQSICEEALERFNALELLGDYPPKSL